jgi:hypothetical protein
MAPALPLAALQLFVAAATVAPASPRIGAVRWDGCAAMPAGPVDPESVTGFCSTRLDLPPNRHRMPFYAKPDGRGGHVVNATKADVAREIAYAQNASLSFFAFVMYGPCSSLGKPLQWFRELSAERAHGMQWCMILESSDFAPPGGNGNAGPMSLWLDYVQDESYLTVGPDKRPVIHIFGLHAVKSAEVFRNFSALVEAKLGVAPYWAGMADPSMANQTVPVDAVSEYTLFPRTNGQPYASLVEAEEAKWQLMARSGLHAIPTVTPNMDPRPMYELPNGTYSACGWCNCNPSDWMDGCHLPLGTGGCHTGNCSTPEHWAQPPLPGETARHTANMVAFLLANSANGVSPFGLGMIGAWNENLEGHWCVPTWTPTGAANTTVLDEIAAGIRAGTVRVASVSTQQQSSHKTDDDDDGGGGRQSTLRSYTPRSYWRFENASDFTVDEMAVQRLENWEGIGARGHEARVWHAQQDGGLVGGWVNSTGVRENVSFETYWEAEMGSVPRNQTATPSAPGITIELLLKPGSCFGRGGHFSFFAAFPPGAGRACSASISSSSIVWLADTIAQPGGAADSTDTGTGTPVDGIEAELHGTGVLSSDNLFDGEWHHFAFVKSGVTGDQSIWIDGQSPAEMQLKGNATGRALATANIYFNARGALTTCAGIDEVAVFEEALPASMIVQHYKDAQAHKRYSTIDPGGPPPPVPAPENKTNFDMQEYPPGTQLPTPPGTVTVGVTQLPEEQLRSFPRPRYAAQHTLRPNCNWMDPGCAFPSFLPVLSRCCVLTAHPAAHPPPCWLWRD